MNIRSMCSWVTLVLTAAVPLSSHAVPLGTAITYQGQLKQSGVPYGGTADLIFTLYDASSGGSVIAGPVTLTGVSVANGLFTVQIDFGSSAFTGDARWIGIQVRSPSGSGSYAALLPRQAVTAVSYALGLYLPISQAVHSYNAGFEVTNTSIGEAVRGNAGDVGSGVYGSSVSGDGVYGESTNGIGVEAFTDTGLYGVFSQALGGGEAVHGTAPAVGGGAYTGALGTPNYGVLATAPSGGIALHAESGNTQGELANGYSGAYGRSSTATGVYGTTAGTAAGYSVSGVYGVCSGPTGQGVTGQADASGSIGVRGVSANGYAGYFTGRGYFSGLLTKAGGGFRIDHPLDPASRYLTHSFVESPDMMNIYNGLVTTDERGYATVTLPDWFEALNRDFRYQLTVIDTADSEQFVQAKVVREIQGNRFTLRTSRPGAKVSWQVTGVRHDAWAEANRIVVEETKPAAQHGRYLNPEVFGQPADKVMSPAVPDSERASPLAVSAAAVPAAGTAGAN